MTESPCPIGCIIHEGKLYGDCRAPWNDGCWAEADYRRQVEERKLRRESRRAIINLIRNHYHADRDQGR